MSVASEPTIFIVEDEAIIAADIRMRLEKLGYNVVGQAAAGEDALPQLEQLRPNLVLMDIMLRGKMTGIETADIIRQRLELPVVFLTAHKDSATLSQAKITEPFGYITKPFEERELHATVEIALYRNRAEQKLRNMERWLATTLRSIGDAVITTDTEARVTYMNPMAEAMTEWPLADAIGKDISLIAPLRATGQELEVENPIWSALREGVVMHLRDGVHLLSRGGNHVPVDDSAAPLRDAQGHVSGAVIVFRNAAERVRTERELKNLNKQLEARASRATQLEQANQRLEEFIYAVSHDLKAPLRAISSYVEIMGAEPVEEDAEQAEFLQRIRQNADRMLGLLDGYLALSRAGHEALQLTDVSMEELVREIATTRFADNQGKIEILPLPNARADRRLIGQVWENLIGNALKYSSTAREPRVVISGRAESGRVAFSVQDNGIGFDSGHAEQLFAPFYRLPEAGKHQGSGLGLAIARRIVENHNGSIWGEGQPGKGALFTFTLPS